MRIKFSRERIEAYGYWSEKNMFSLSGLLPLSSTVPATRMFLILLTVPPPSVITVLLFFIFLLFRILIHWLRIGIQPLRLKNWKKISYFLSKIATYFSLGLHKGRLSYCRSLQPSKRTSSTSKLFSIFVFRFCPSGSGSGLRIWIHWRVRIRIRFSGSGANFCDLLLLPISPPPVCRKLEKALRFVSVFLFLFFCLSFSPL